MYDSEGSYQAQEAMLEKFEEECRLKAQHRNRIRAGRKKIFSNLNKIAINLNKKGLQEEATLLQQIVEILTYEYNNDY